MQAAQRELVGELTRVLVAPPVVATTVETAAASVVQMSSPLATPAGVLWTHAEPFSETRECVSGEDSDLQVVVRETDVAVGWRRADLEVYTASSPLPLWTYSFAQWITTGSRVGVSRDGSLITAAISDDANGEVELASFGPLSPQPQAYRVLATSGPLRGFDLSNDGSTLLVSAGGRAYLLDPHDLTTRFEADVGSQLDALAISGNGDVFAVGGYNWVRVYERSGASWAPTYTRALAGQNFVGALDVSTDGSAVAWGFTFYDQFLDVRIESLDVTTKQVTMSELVSGSGALQNVVADVAVSDDGERFAVGLWGDEAATVAELRYYSRSSSTALALVDLPGSVFDVAISGDGRRVAAASKAIHANVLGLGGAITLYDAGGADLALRGTPRLGSSPTVELHTTPGRRAWLLVAPRLALQPLSLPGVGTMYLDRDSALARELGPADNTGLVQRGFPLPSDPLLAGTTLYLQGHVRAPTELSSTWLALTLLP